MEVGGREQIVVPPPVDTAVDGFRDHAAHRRIVEHVEPQREVPQAGPPGDGRREQDPSGAQHPKGLTEGRHSVRPVDQVVERAEHQHGVSRPVGLGQTASVPDLGRHLRMEGPGLRHVQVDRVDQGHPMAQIGEPSRIAAGPTTHVQHVERRRGQVARQQLLRARELERARGKPPVEPVELVAPVVVRPYRRVELIHGRDPCPAMPRTTNAFGASAVTGGLPMA